MISSILMSVNSPQSTKLLYNMLTYFFSSPRLSCVQNLATRQHFLLSKNMNILRSFLVICLLTFLLFPLSIKAFSNQLIKSWIFNQLSPRVLYFVFFYLPASVTRLHNCIGPELVPADLHTREFNHNRLKFFIKEILTQLILAVPEVNKLSNFLS